MIHGGTLENGGGTRILLFVLEMEPRAVDLFASQSTTPNRVLESFQASALGVAGVGCRTWNRQ